MAAVTAEAVEAKLRSELKATEVKVVDTSGGCGQSFEVTLCVSEQFDGMKAIAKHRAVNGALAEELKTIHALSIKKLLTPAQHAAEA